MDDNQGLTIFLLELFIGIVLWYLIMDIVGYYSVPNDLASAIKIMVRQAARWSTAAEQDSNAMIAVLHANYGAGYLWALKDIARDGEIEQITGIDMKKFTAEIIKVQDNAAKKMAKLCPKYAPTPTYLTKIGGE